MTKTYVYLKHRTSPRGSMQKYDVAFIYPMVSDQGKATLDTYVPVVMDLNIPCSLGLVKGMEWNVDASGAMWHCSPCPYNDYTQCDVVKYLLPKWSVGTLESPPVMLAKRAYKIDYTKYLSINEVLSVENADKKEQKKTEIYDLMKTREQIKTIIEVKK